MPNLNKYKSAITPTWCPGCNNFIFYSQIQKVLEEKKINTKDMVFCYDIGCSGNFADFFQTYGVHTLHGRCIPVAWGVKLANPKLTVACFGGDGGLYGEGLNHLIAAARANLNVKIFVANNYLYSLTTGQTSPTTPKGAKTKSTPYGNLNVPLDPVALIKAVNPHVFAKTVSSTDISGLTTAISDVFDHHGFAMLDISQTCVAFGKQLKA